MTHPLTWLTTCLNHLLARQAAPAQASRQRVDPQRLRRILVVVSRCRGARSSDQLLVDQLSPDGMLFLTAADVGEGDVLELSMLVPGFGNLSLEGTIAWLRPSRGGLQGELVLQPEPHQRQVLASFLQRDALGHR